MCRNPDVAQPSPAAGKAVSCREFQEHAPGRCYNPPARTPALRLI
jgi:hypothetical protein